MMTEQSGLQVAAIVVTYESRAVLPACLASLSEAGIPAIVVDNASSDDSADIARSAGAAVIINATNQGYGRANNQGIRAAEGAAWCLVINPDVTLTGDAMALLTRAARSYPDAAIVAPQLVEPDGRYIFRTSSLLAPEAVGGCRRSAPPEGDCCTPFVPGACFLVRRDVFLQLGGFDEHIFLFYEDDDLCRRVRDAGYSIIHVHDAVARHFRGGSSKSKPGKVFRSRYHQAWSRAYVCRKYGLDPCNKLAMLRNALKLLGAAVVLNRSRVERYAGSLAGAIDAMRGRSALAHEGLK